MVDKQAESAVADSPQKSPSRRRRLLLAVAVVGIALAAGEYCLWQRAAGGGYPRLSGDAPDGSWVIFSYKYIPSTAPYSGTEYQWLVALRDDGHVAVSPRCYDFNKYLSYWSMLKDRPPSERRVYGCDQTWYLRFVMYQDRMFYLDTTNPESAAVARLVQRTAEMGTDTEPLVVPENAAAATLREWRDKVGYPELLQYDLGLRAREVLAEIANGEWVTDTNFGQPPPPPYYSSTATLMKLTWHISGITGGTGTNDDRYPVGAATVLEKLREELLLQQPGEGDAYVR